MSTIKPTAIGYPNNSSDIKKYVFILWPHLSTLTSTTSTPNLKPEPFPNFNNNDVHVFSLCPTTVKVQRLKYYKVLYVCVFIIWPYLFQPKA